MNVLLVIFMIVMMLATITLTITLSTYLIAESVATLKEYERHGNKQQTKGSKSRESLSE